MDANLYLAFVAASLVFLLSPGPVMAIILQQTVFLGVREGLYACLGAMLGRAAMAAAAASALIWSLDFAAQHARWFALAAAGYLVFMAFKTASRPWPEAASDPSSMLRLSPTQPFVNGFAVTMCNPATILFYAAFLPQFISPGYARATQYLVLLATQLCMALLVGVVCVLVASRFELKRRNWRILGAARWMSASIYIAVATVTVVGFMSFDVTATPK